jgi:nucleotide-binding universal stress UspA family protein
VPKPVTSLPLKRVAIAWKDVREARRAVRDALPLLQKAESVMIVEISEGGDGSLQRLKDVAGYLNRHGIEIVAERVRPLEIGAADALLRLAHDENINLIVAGAYGHSRLGEWVFGGVTRGLLDESQVCCLFSH